MGLIGSSSVTPYIFFRRAKILGFSTSTRHIEHESRFIINSRYSLYIYWFLSCMNIGILIGTEICLGVLNIDSGSVLLYAS
jgi:hypothetical protein